MAKRDELEHIAYTRIAAIGDALEAENPEYLDGLSTTLAVAIDYGLAALDVRVQETAPVPIQLLAQARLAARNGISLEIVLRRYAAGQSLLADAMFEEAAESNVDMAELRNAMRSLASRFDRVIAAVSEEYERERLSEPQVVDRQFGAIQDLLAGESLDIPALHYKLDVSHLAMVGSGSCISEDFAALARGLQCELLLTCPDEYSAWAWLGSPSRFDASEFKFITSFPWQQGSTAACGESGEGVAGWRLSHQQATAAHLVARRSNGAFARYCDVALLACALQNRLLATSLRRAYLLPLERGRDQGRAAKQTLRAYFAASRNVSSAAAALRVNRRTVSARLANVEAHLGRRLDINCAELETALRLDELGPCSDPVEP